MLASIRVGSPVASNRTESYSPVKNEFTDRRRSRSAGAETTAGSSEKTQLLLEHQKVVAAETAWLRCLVPTARK